MYKMIIIDLDGTLLNSQKEVSKEDAYMINKAYQEKGVISVIATGRPYICAKYVANIVGESFSQYIIASTGSIIRDNKNNVDLNRRCISNEDTAKVMELVKKYSFKCIVDIESKVLGNGRLVNQKSLEKIGQPYEIKENMEEYFINNKIGSITITLIDAEGEKEKLLKVIEELKIMENLQLTEICEALDVTENGTKKVTYIDIISKGCTKQNAIMMLAQYLNISKEEIIVIGDGGNDIPMFEMAGLKIAMKNALDIIKQKADYVTASNNESGVAKAIKKFIFGEN